MNESPRRAPDLFWPIILIGVGLVFLLVAAGSLGPSSYFLHQDTVTQDVAAVDLIHGCWGYTAATLAPMVILSVPVNTIVPSVTSGRTTMSHNPVIGCGGFSA